MASEFKVPELGENIESGVIVKLLVAAGETLQLDQPIMELETGKATLEVPSTIAGVIKEIRVKEGDEVKVDQVVLVVEDSGKAEASPAKAAPKADLKKTEPEIQSKPLKQEEKPAPAASPTPQKPDVPTPAVTPGAAVAASPSVRRFACELGVDISRVHGTGPKNRISIEDVKAHVKQAMTSPAPAAAAAGSPVLPDFTKYGGIKREAMSAIRRRTAEHLSLCWSEIPHVTQFDNADITELEETRKFLSKRAESSGVKVTLTVILARVVTAALKAFPKFNASVDMQRREIVLKDYYNMGFAVDTDRGLLVPVIREIDKMNMIQIACELAGLAAKAREGKIHPDDLSGGNFTITNLGGIGGTHFSPIINWPEVAILGVGRASVQLDPRDPSRTRLILPLSLSYDHRVIDGAEGIRFLRWVIEFLEEPMRLLLDH